MKKTLCVLALAGLTLGAFAGQPKHTKSTTKKVQTVTKNQPAAAKKKAVAKTVTVKKTEKTAKH